MARSKPEKISTSGASNPLENALGHALEGLNIGPLPAGEEAASSAKTGNARKPGKVVLRKETAHRGGKSVIVVDGFEAEHDDRFIADLARQLRAVCGCGGTVRERKIELQGNNPGKVREYLIKEGFQVGGVH